RCRHMLETRADLTKYTYPFFSRDLETVRLALGYGPVDLFAGSYGTRAAQAYLRLYPQSVRTVYLGSVIPLESGGPLYFARTEDAALERTFKNCAADAACNRAYPHLEHEFGQLMEQLAPAQGHLEIHIKGTDRPVALYRGAVVEWLRSMLYRPRDAAALP